MSTLGELEIQVLEWLWSHSEGTAKSIHETIHAQRDISLNTIQSTVERLRKKQLVTRTKQGHSYLYRALVDKEQLLGNLIVDLFGRFESDLDSSAAAIMRATETIDENALDALEKAIQAKRQSSETSS